MKKNWYSYILWDDKYVMSLLETVPWTITDKQRNFNLKESKFNISISFSTYSPVHQGVQSALWGSSESIFISRS
jgi:hypothetical protein